MLRLRLMRWRTRLRFLRQAPRPFGVRFRQISVGIFYLLGERLYGWPANHLLDIALTLLCRNSVKDVQDLSPTARSEIVEFTIAAVR
jgi:hypothetical protein